MDNKIDIVVMWVDGNDPKWLEEKNKYTPKTKKDNSASDNRFRDWNLMKYWFRGVEKFAPWVNNVYFITWGHYPKWLNIDNPKLKIVKHADYIPEELLPTFNSNVIEMHLNNIEDLEEQFILFNDDIFLIKDTTPEDFFINGKPCESALLGVLSSQDYNDVFPHILINNCAIINKHFDKKEVLSKHRNKFIAKEYGKDVIRNILLKPFVYFSDFRDLHLASAHLKSNFDEIWKAEPEIMYNATKSKFRSKEDVNQWLIKNWYMCKGDFVPRSPKWGRKFELGAEQGECDYIKKQKGKVICLNESSDDIDFEHIQKKLIEAFEAILPDKCGYEK
ncbi:stealth family protein [Pseudobutyrivibrio ruminis]|uniref:stealth family protein n=1 Tax=Pseudobutyrivibrio ruminis TaxID=46206 RepID=UPI00041018D5|nr:stealth family protein [Pseudobutyrivibrio ruminis]